MALTKVSPDAVFLDSVLHSMIMELLAPCVGEARAMSAEDLQCAVSNSGVFLPVAELRGVIREMRKLGHLIGSGQGGYFIPANLGEAIEYVDVVFRAPSRDQLQTARIQRQAAMRKFGGQLTLL